MLSFAVVVRHLEAHVAVVVVQLERLLSVGREGMGQIVARFVEVDG
jgi:hypothetical protein